MRLALLILFSFFLFSCENEEHRGYKRAEHNIYYQYRAIGDESRKAEVSDVITCRLTLLNWKGDTLYDPLQPVTFKLSSNSNVDRTIMKFSDQDSFSLKWDATEQELSNSLRVFGSQMIKDRIQADMRIIKVRSNKEYKRDSVQYQLSPIEEEKKLISDFLNWNHIDSSALKDSIYFIPIIKNAAGKNVERGQFIQLEYVGRFLDGRIFDDSKLWKEEFVIQYGKPMQLVSGLERALSWMKEGEVAKIILPSQHAFGKRGSGLAKIPPNTPLVYELKLIKIY